MKPSTLCCALICAFGIAGCGGGKVQELEQTVAGLEKRISTLEQSEKANAARVSNIGFELLMVKLSSVKTAWFDPQDQKAYTAVQSPVGQVLFVLEKVEPYLDGFKLTFRVGNPSTASLNGFEAEVEWGRALPEDPKAETPPTKKVKLKFTESVRSGAWTLITANVAPAKPEEIRRIGITPSFNNISLVRGF